MRRFFALILATLSVAGISFLALGASPAAASACTSSSGVTVVVDYKGSIQVGCATSFSNGEVALQSAGFSYALANSGLVNQVAGNPDPAPQVPPTNAYWGYFHGTPGGTWTYSSKGAGGYHPAAGSVEGWSFGAGNAPGIAPPSPPAPAPATTKAPAPAPAPAPVPAPAPAATAAAAKTTAKAASTSTKAATATTKAGTPTTSAKATATSAASSTSASSSAASTSVAPSASGAQSTGAPAIAVSANGHTKINAKVAAKKSSSGGIIGVVVVLVIAAGGGGALWYLQKRSRLSA